MEAAILHYLESSWHLASSLLKAQWGKLEAYDQLWHLKQQQKNATPAPVDEDVAVAATADASTTLEGLQTAVLENRQLLLIIASWMTQGALHALSVTCRFWLAEAFEGAPAAWERIDLSDWPFAAKELQLLRSAEPPSRPLPLVPPCNRDLALAVARVPRGHLKSLVACSSKLTDEGIRRALQQHGASLRELKLSSCQSGILTGGSLAPLRHKAEGIALKKLDLDGFKWPGLRGLARSCHLQELSISGQLCTQSVHPIGAFANLRVLKVDHKDAAKLPQAPFLYIFHNCTLLHTVDIYSATQVTDALLACLMSRNQQLKDFYGSCSRLPASLPNFRSHYPNAERLVVDEVDAVRGAVAQFMEGAMIQLIDTMLARLHQRLQRDELEAATLQAAVPARGEPWWP